MTVADPDGSLPFSLKYFGAIATGRWSGDAGLNLQNFNREPLHGVDPRRCLIARPGHKLLIADLSRIEPRVPRVDGGRLRLAGENTWRADDLSGPRGNFDGFSPERT